MDHQWDSPGWSASPLAPMPSYCLAVGQGLPFCLFQACLVALKSWPPLGPVLERVDATGDRLAITPSWACLVGPQPPWVPPHGRWSLAHSRAPVKRPNGPLKAC